MKNTNKNQRNTLIMVLVLMFGYSMVYMDKSMVSQAIVPIAGEFGFNNSQTGLMMSLYFFSYSVFQLILGRLADRIGSKAVLIISIGLSAVSSIFFGLAGSLMMFYSIRLLSGLAHSGYPSSCSKTIADNFPLEKRSMFQSFMISTSGIGGLLAFVLGARLISRSWNHAYLILGLIQAAAAVLLILFIPNKKRETGEIRGPKINYFQIVFNKNVLLLCLSLILFNFLGYGINSWASKYLQEQFHMSMNDAGLILSVNSIISTVASMGIGMLLTRVLKGKEKIYAAGAMILSGFLVFLLSRTDNLTVAAVCLVLAFALAVSAFATLISFPHRILPKEAIGSSMGIINGLGTLGGFFAPVVLGVAIDRTQGYGIPFLIIAGSGVLCGLVTMFLSNDKVKLT